MAKKPELLMPAGNIRAFYAALEGGADAIYLGLQEFNARKRANNFTIEQVPVLAEIAGRHNVRVYITLNTVIKNKELSALYSMLYQLSQTNIQAIIIQDWGTYYLLKKYFPKISIHASTQMAFHNSAAVNFGQKAGIERIILARELTLKELQQIRKQNNIELELFVHGALCYSFSGLCMFSSHFGGMSANRGSCKQSCRWQYNVDEKKEYIFSLKDIELIEFVPELARIGINSLKIEGRMKSFDYVYTVAKAYRMVLDDSSKISEARELLKEEIGREKTSYFMGGNVSDTFTSKPNTGLFTGQIKRVENRKIYFTSVIDPNTIKRIRICSADGARQQDLTLENISIIGNEVSAPIENMIVKKNDEVYVIGYSTKSFASRLPVLKGIAPKTPPKNDILSKVQSVLKTETIIKKNLWLRINSPAWIKILNFEEADFYILSFSINEWGEILRDKSLEFSNNKIIVGLPKFISEDTLSKYKDLIGEIHLRGIRAFMISHVSQTEILPAGGRFYADENIYTFNDAAIGQLQQFGFSGHIYPFENDLENLNMGKDRTGIVPLYFLPQLFYSRMPVRSGFKQNKITDDNKVAYRIINHHGMTVTLPENPVSILHSKDALIKQGFRNFLIDLSFVTPLKETFVQIVNAYNRNLTIEPSSTFNFKKGLS